MKVYTGDHGAGNAHVEPAVDGSSAVIAADTGNGTQCPAGPGSAANQRILASDRAQGSDSDPQICASTLSTPDDVGLAIETASQRHGTAEGGISQPDNGELRQATADADGLKPEGHATETWAPQDLEMKPGPIAQLDKLEAQQEGCDSPLAQEEKGRDSKEPGRTRHARSRRRRDATATAQHSMPASRPVVLKEEELPCEEELEFSDKQEEPADGNKGSSAMDPRARPTGLGAAVEVREGSAGVTSEAAPLRGWRTQAMSPLAGKPVIPLNAAEILEASEEGAVTAKTEDAGGASTTPFAGCAAAVQDNTEATSSDKPVPQVPPPQEVRNGRNPEAGAASDRERSASAAPEHGQRSRSGRVLRTPKVFSGLLPIVKPSPSPRVLQGATSEQAACPAAMDGGACKAELPLATSDQVLAAPTVTGPLRAPNCGPEATNGKQSAEPGSILGWGGKASRSRGTNGAGPRQPSPASPCPVGQVTMRKSSLGPERVSSAGPAPQTDAADVKRAAARAPKAKPAVEDPLVQIGWKRDHRKGGGLLPVWAPRGSPEALAVAGVTITDLPRVDGRKSASGSSRRTPSRPYNGKSLKSKSPGTARSGLLLAPDAKRARTSTSVALVAQQPLDGSQSKKQVTQVERPVDGGGVPEARPPAGKPLDTTAQSHTPGVAAAAAGVRDILGKSVATLLPSADGVLDVGGRSGIPQTPLAAPASNGMRQKVGEQAMSSSSFRLVRDRAGDCRCRPATGACRCFG